MHFYQLVEDIMRMPLTIFTDGASLGNPGPMGIGVVVYLHGKKIKEISEYIGHGTNNIAEYTALIRALEFAVGFAKESGAKDVHIKADSQLIIRQMNGEYKVKDEKLKPLKRKADSLCIGLHVKFEHIPREKNEEADVLSKEAAERGKKMDIKKQGHKAQQSGVQNTLYSFWFE
jgi:ribonuclease HI